MKKILSFDIGGTTIKYGLLNYDGNIIWKKQMDTEAHLGGSSIIDKVKSKIRESILVENIYGVAISSAGIINSETGEVAEASDTIRGYKGQKIKEAIEKEFNLKTTVENDVNCAALGELWKGAGKGKKNIACMTIGTGVGGAIIIDGKILKGSTFSSGEVGYLSFGDQTLDTAGSTRGIVKRVANSKGISENEVNGKIIFELAKKGDKIAIEEIDSMVDKITSTMATISYIINPEIIILGGGITNQKEYLLPKFKEKAKEKIIPYVYNSLEIKLAELENDAGIIGAVYNFINKS